MAGHGHGDGSNAIPAVAVERVGESSLSEAEKLTRHLGRGQRNVLAAEEEADVELDFAWSGRKNREPGVLLGQCEVGGKHEASPTGPLPARLAQLTL